MKNNQVTKEKFQIGNYVELVSNSYEDGYYYQGDKGKVIDLMICNKTGEVDIRVEWDSVNDTCWMAAEDFSLIGY